MIRSAAGTVLLSLLLALAPGGAARAQNPAPVVPAPAPASTPFEARLYQDPAGPGTLPYRILLPDPLEPGVKYPLVLFFHGAGERGADDLAQLKHGVGVFATPENRKRFPAIVIAAQCPAGKQWVDMPWGAPSGTRPAQPSEPMRLALGLLDESLATLPADPRRVYLAGLSMGGYAVWDCVTRFPEKFAGAIAVCGGGDEATVTARAAAVPVWAFHSDDDPTVPAVRTRHMVEAMKAAGGQPRFTEYHGLGHNSWDRAYAEPELLPWLFAQARPDAP